MRDQVKTYFEILDELKARDFNATHLFTYDFSTLYTTLPHNLIKDKSIDLVVDVVVDSNRQFYTANEHCVLYCI